MFTKCFHDRVGIQHSLLYPLHSFTALWGESWGSHRGIELHKAARGPGLQGRERADRSSLCLTSYQLSQWSSAAFWKHSVQVEGRLKTGTVSGLELWFSGNSVPQTHFSAAAAVGVLCWVALPSRCHHLEAQPELTATALGWDECEGSLSH